MGLFGFVDSMNSVIRLHLNNAFYEGAALEGIGRDELSDREIMARDDLVNSELLYVMDFGQSIIATDQASGGALTPHLQRAELWASRYESVKTKARLMAAGDKKKRWVYGDTKHCPDCENLDGRVYRASTWDKYDIRPQSHNLNCIGVHCRCRMEDTDERCTPGRPPNLVGPGRRKWIFRFRHALQPNSVVSILTGRNAS